MLFYAVKVVLSLAGSCLCTCACLVYIEDQNSKQKRVSNARAMRLEGIRRFGSLFSSFEAPYYCVFVLDL